MSDWTGYVLDQEIATKILEKRIEIWHDALAHQNGTQTSIAFSEVPENDSTANFKKWLDKIVSKEGGEITEEETCWRINFAKAA